MVMRLTCTGAMGSEPELCGGVADPQAALAHVATLALLKCKADNAGTGEASSCGTESPAPKGATPPPVTVDNKQLGKKWGTHSKDYGYDASDSEGREWYQKRIDEVTQQPDETRQGPWNPNGGGGTDYFFFKKDNDLVVATGKGDFVTLFPMEGGTNAWYEQATPVGGQ